MADFVKTIGALIVAAGGAVLLIAGVTKSSTLPLVLGVLAIVLAVALGLSRAVRKR